MLKFQGQCKQLLNNGAPKLETRRGRRNCIQANSNECDRPVFTDLRLGEKGKLDKSELRRVFNCIEVGRHSTAKLIKMKTDKYNVPIKREVVDDNINMKVPDEIATDIAKKKI